MQATAIERDAAELANARNADVISLAFRQANVSCPNCNFPKNCGEFRSLLWTYTEAKIRLHRIEKIDRWPFHRWDSWRWRTDRAIEADIEQVANYTRHLLRNIWPCQDCIERYNPTGKKKHPSFNAPQGKDFIE